MRLNNNPESTESGNIFKMLPQNQKIAVIVLTFFGLFIIVFWIYQFNSRLTNPLYAGLDKKNVSSAPTTDYVASLKAKDTDSDGLLDYDELYVYSTSPYLADTDSDGINDGEEIKNNSDPLCPQGKNCNAATPLVASTTTLPVAATDNTEANLNSAGLDSNALQRALSGQIDAATLRQLLISSGADASIVNQISDDDLMKSYQATLNSQNQNTVNETNVATSSDLTPNIE